MKNRSEPVKILLAEDDPDDQYLFQQALNEAEATATLETVEDGKKLMKYLAQVDGQNPDIIFLDINMPFKDGKQCLKEIRANKKLDAVPVVIFSTSSYENDIEETFANGANLYIAKPSFFYDVVKIFQKIFSHNWKENLLKHDKNNFVLDSGKI
jgi:CheY-like chemotaxis protein